ncbi:hypothetical protein CLV28_0276 [Sediminihabitans luteus]|uniref:Transcription factor zinc-finger domain-containing protein n=1 Tax=Sediminihabitans luteus TaxID=1138585 RepID=A0A2M9CYQ3_9CELL|nr:zf-TFIIB domain-containing protein [Sediminihabitans luteus]PJJ77064.1 hypothetical protein CLV28_0276 [Sediminihabitans luteus]GIJ00417.1 hypothetical protein Slu03_27940 [Sediminihabitans luteus]
MQCPVDQSVLVMSERSGVEIDYCPTCRGVWLDRGELDKIVERAATGAATPPANPGPAPAQQYPPTAAATSAPDYGYDQRGHDQRGYDQRGQDQRGYDQRGQDQRAYDQRGYDQRIDPRTGKAYKKRKKESWLEDLFDF